MMMTSAVVRACKNENPAMIMKFLVMKIKIKYIVLGVVAVVLAHTFGLFTHLFEIDYHTQFIYPLDIDIKSLLSELKAGRKTTIKPINEYSYRFKIKNEEKCKTDEEIRLLYVIKSELENTKQRDAIRNSWGWEKRFSDVTIRRVFIFGINSHKPLLQDKIDEEYEKFNDIIQADFIDSYYNNTIKTMMAFKWIVHYCPKAQYIFFSDDDMYVSTKNLLAFIRSFSNFDPRARKLLSSSMNSSFDVMFSVLSDETRDESYQNIYDNKNSIGQRSRRQILSIVDYDRFDTRLLAGYVFFSSPMRHKPSKWYITLEEYPFSKYPPYVTAGAYITNHDCVVDMYYTSLYTKHFRFDDIFLGIVAKKAGITPIHNDEFYFWKKDYNKDSYNSVIASHGYKDPKELLKVWEEQRSLGYA